MKRPRILVTRTRTQASGLAARLEAIGAETILVPTIEIVEPQSFVLLDAAIADLSQLATSYDWLIFTSANAVQALAARAETNGLILRPRHVAAIGPATANAIERAGLRPASGSVVLPPRYIAESLAEALLKQAGDRRRHYLLVRAEDARDVIPTALEAAGHRVTVAAAYRNVTPPDTIPVLTRLFGSEGSLPDVITFTSSSTARNLVDLLGSVGHAIPSQIALASIGPITSATLRELGYEPTFEAAEPTVESLVLAISEHLKLN